MQKIKSQTNYLKSFSKNLALLVAGMVLLNVPLASAVTNPQNGSIGIEATISGPPPSQPPSVTVPSNSQSFGSQPITVAGLCQNGLLVKIFDNNVFVGSTVCKSGSFTLQVSLFSGGNALSAIQYDGLNQSSPSSGSVKVTYTAQVPPAFGSQVLSLSTDYALKGANPGQKLVWPISISGGTPPYALSVDWGDKTKPQLISEAFSGPVSLSHTYQAAGTYTVTIQATDKNGETAFLQLVAVANGPAAIGQAAGSSGGSSIKTITKVIWWPLLIFIPMLIVAFWLGGRQALLNLQKRLEKSEQNLQ